jgi:glycosyltransferase involved in cell wall biosynthesis
MAHSVAVIPCYNEGNNPAAVVASVLVEPLASVILVDDASDGMSRAALDALSLQPRVRVLRNRIRSGKSAAARRGFENLPADAANVMMIDGDVVLPPATVRAVLDELDRVDLVATNSQALQDPASWWERGAIFSANLQRHMRNRFFDRYPARFTNGRFIGMSRRLVDAVLAASFPPEAEDAHIALVCISQGMTYSFRRDAILHGRAPSYLKDYAAQAIRFRDAERILGAYWPKEELAKHFHLRSRDVVRAFLAEAAQAPPAALAFTAMYAFSRLASLRRSRALESGLWPIATSTKLPG